MKNNFLKNKTILITGGTGSIGSGLVSELTKTDCKVIRILSNDENGLYELSRKLNLSLLAFDNFSKEMEKNKVRFFLGDIRDIKRCYEVTKNVDIVIHAAALKHVSIVEYNPTEGFKTNFIGTKNILKASVNNKVSKFLFISTDKVVSAKNIMGKTKLMAEKFVINFKKKNKTKISIIRFGNVIGSRGSVVPNFVNLLKNKKNITVTDRRMTRFIMSLKEASYSIIKSIKIMKGGEIFILKSMKCFKIIDLALILIRYFHKINKKKNKVLFSKSNTGEKFQEELYSNNEIDYINIKDDLFIIGKKKVKKSKKDIMLLEKFRVSKFNFLNQNQILKLLIKLKILINLG